MPAKPPFPRPLSFLRAAAWLPLAVCLLQGSPARAEGGPWETITRENGVAYVSMDNLRSFYKFRDYTHIPSGQRASTVAVSYFGFPVVFFPGTTRVFIGGYECKLVHPTLKQANGDLLVSQTDAVKLLDPVLRATYITPRRQVKTVIIDPAHGGSDTGVAANGVQEQELALQLAESLRNVLEKRGFKVILTRDQNRTVPDRDRLAHISRAEAPVFVSIHINKGRSDVSGIETYCVQPVENGQRGCTGNACDEANAALAFSLHAALVEATGAEDGACRRTRSSRILNSVSCPAAIVQVGFASNPEEAAKLGTTEYRNKLAVAMADGIATFTHAMAPGATIPSSSPAADDYEPPIPYHADPPAPPKPQEPKQASKPQNSGKNQKAGKPAPSKGKTTKTNNTTSSRSNSGRKRR